MKTDYYLYRKNRKVRKSIKILVNSIVDDGNIIKFNRGMIGTDDYECGQNQYSVRSSDYEYEKVGEGCYPELEIFRLWERKAKIIRYWKEKESQIEDPIIAE